MCSPRRRTLATLFSCLVIAAALLTLASILGGCTLFRSDDDIAEATARGRALGREVGIVLPVPGGAAVGEWVGGLLGAAGLIYGVKKHGDAKTERARNLPPATATTAPAIGTVP